MSHSTETEVMATTTHIITQTITKKRSTTKKIVGASRNSARTVPPADAVPAELQQRLQHNQSISLEKVRDARRNFNQFLNMDGNKKKTPEQIGRVITYEDNIQIMFGEKTATHAFEEYMDRSRMNSVELSLTDFCHETIKKFICSHTIAKMRVTMYRSLNDELKEDIKLCPKILVLQHREVFIMFHSCRFISEKCTVQLTNTLYSIVH